MLYPIPQRFTDEDFEVGWNQELSDLDKELARLVYPKEGKAATQLLVDAEPIQAEIGEKGELDVYMFVVQEQGRYLIETTGRTDLVMSLFGPDDSTNFRAEDDDSGRGLNPRLNMILRLGTYTVHIRNFSRHKTGDYGIFVRRDF
ncbi:hypothetical protein KFU94_15720 [Chloroflexi bacterium TSY]|nr:hypothetical protein [Chloroflexi bacterium TSY]